MEGWYEQDNERVDKGRPLEYTKIAVAMRITKEDLKGTKEDLKGVKWEKSNKPYKKSKKKSYLW